MTRPPLHSLLRRRRRHRLGRPWPVAAGRVVGVVGAAMSEPLIITRGHLHSLLTEAHVAMVEHRAEFAGAVLHVLRRLTGPEPAVAPVAPASEPAPAPAPEPTAKPKPGAIVHRAKARAPGAGGRVATVWTAERVALLRAEFPACRGDAWLLAQLNALPGEPIATVKALTVKAQKEGLRRAVAAPAIEAEPAEPEPVEPEPEPVEAAPVLIAPARKDEKGEVFDAFDAGMTVRDASVEFGLPLSTLANWQAEWRLARKQMETAA